MISATAGIAIILLVNKRLCHIVSFFAMFLYLLYVRTITKVSGPCNMIQMVLTLRCVGLAMEVNSAYFKKDAITDYEKELLSLNAYDILAYAFNYIGLLTGPYYSYRTFLDYFRFRFGQFADCNKATIDTFKYIPGYVAVYLLAGYFFPLNYAKSDEFYTERSVLYRLWYVFPTFLIFRCRMYAGLTLSECVCTLAGFGAYPKQALSKSGAGPTIEKYEELEASADRHEYDFQTVRNMDVYGTETCWTFREAMKTWNMCVQYWLAVYVYKRFPSKKFRTLATLITSAIWHGIYPGYYFCICGAPFYLPVEDVWNKLIRKDATGLKRRIIDVIFAISKWFAYSYMAIAFLLMTIDRIWFYYSSVYHFPYVLWAVLYISGVVLLKMRPKKPRIDESTKKAE